MVIGYRQNFKVNSEDGESLKLITCTPVHYSLTSKDMEDFFVLGCNSQNGNTKDKVNMAT